MLGEEAWAAVVLTLRSLTFGIGAEQAATEVLSDLAPHVAALVAQARDNCPGEPSQDGGVVDTVIRLITSARADGAAEWEGVAERAQETVKRVAETLDCFDEYEHDGGEDHMPSDCPRCIVGAFRSALDGSS